MKYRECNIFCDDGQDVHYLGRIKAGIAVDWDEFLVDNGRTCCGCGMTGRPHLGFGFPCAASSSGAHYFTLKDAKRNAIVRR